MSTDLQQAGKARRDKAVSMAMKRKEEYLGARVPKELRDRVIQRAKEMGIPVSILIRNTLEEAFKGTDSDQGLVSPVTNLTSAELTSDKFSAVLGWEKLLLNKTVSCSSCRVELKQATEAFLGIGASEPIVICNACKGRV
jgi:hypothetical protein